MKMIYEFMYNRLTLCKRFFKEIWLGIIESFIEQGANIYIYFYLIILFILFGIVFYIKWRFPFWNTMPMFHTYDYLRYLSYKPDIIQKLPRKTGYCNTELVKTYSYDLVDLSTKKTMMDLMKKYYLTTDQTFNTHTIEDIDTIMTGQIQPSYLSFYYQQLFDLSANLILLPIGCITSHALNLYLGGSVSYPLYYLDFLSISLNTRPSLNEKKILIQSHLYNQRIQNPFVKMGLFKKEGESIRGLVPFVKYKTYFYSLPKKIKTIRLEKHTILLKIYNENIDYLREFLEKEKKFEICILGDLPHLMGLIKRGLLHIYVLKRRNVIMGIYFFKQEMVEWENGESSIQLIACCCWSVEGESFYRGFLFAIKDLLREDSQRRILKIDDISDNSIILMRWALTNRSFMENENNYYFYNFFYPYQEPIRRKQNCLILDI
jgi:hypothetical protein